MPPLKVHSTPNVAARADGKLSSFSAPSTSIRPIHSDGSCRQAAQNYFVRLLLSVIAARRPKYASGKASGMQAQAKSGSLDFDLQTTNSIGANFDIGYGNTAEILLKALTSPGLDS
ncbi:hypothetical protein GLAREA_00612 [Glarea lozoyensis ATCC 20868]|uniref:Uncharacterized protein n=1 Tax=Glarea lozoyensis (strain ATCC 20868 / MF5171) TaxID=1116229 RepID=S3CSP4_GLAL2|nr:uncharacterized protein GLAREA_00612 [Glarea lozoyensis ATCC 20868]EPE29452.1 hypothetical protein GLAREA_00612 [Glarea lozoyensis ATCC 20868]